MNTRSEHPQNNPTTQGPGTGCSDDAALSAASGQTARPESLRATAVGGPGGWHGAIAIGRKIVWRCPHAHQNRDNNSTVHWAAHSCAGLVLQAVSDPDGFDRSRQWAGNYSRSAADAEFARKSFDWASSIAPEVRAALARAESSNG